MALQARLERMRKLVQVEADAISDRPASPEVVSHGTDSGSGGVSLENAQPEIPASKQGTSNETDTAIKGPRLATGENEERRFIWRKDAESSYNPGGLDSMRLSTAPPDTAGLAVTDLQRGDLVSARHGYSPINAIAKYPYKYCKSDRDLMQKIASTFFDDKKIWKREWDLYYVWDIEETKPIILVRESQLQTLIDEINLHYRLKFKIDSHQREEGFVVRLPDHPRCLPRYLGRSHSKEDVDNMTDNVPKASYRAAGEASHPPLQPPTLKEFKQLIEDLTEVQKSKSRATKMKKQVECLDKNKSMADQFKRAQRYLGLRSTVQADQAPASQSTAIDASLPAPFAFEQSVVFVCVDVESHERAHHKITEVGIATLDTRDLVGVAPGENGEAWREKIRARHFRINEHRHLVNSDFVIGYPDGFMFGESTFVPLKEAQHHVEACFRAPFGAQVSSDIVDTLSKNDPTERRNIIFLGHDTKGDIAYLQQLDYDPMKMENILEAMDTATMYKVWHRDQQPTNLGKILANFNIIGWKLHNAGNDAVYTVQAMLAICVKEATMRSSPDLEELRNKEKNARLKAALDEAKQKDEADAKGWSDHEINGDGGEPVPLAAAGITKSIPLRPKSQTIPQYDGACDYDGHGRGRGRGGPTSGVHVRSDNQRGRGSQASRGSRGGPERGGSRGGRSRGRARGQAQDKGRGRSSSAASSATAPQPAQSSW